MASCALQKLLLKQFEAHQRSEGKRSVNVETRVAQISQKLEELALTNQVESISLDHNNNSGNESSLQDELATILLQFVDCAIATDVSNDTKDSIESILELAAAVASTHVRVAEQILSRAVTFSQVLLERVRATACRLVGYLVQNLMMKHNYSNAEDLLDAASQALLPRFTDKSQSVRQAAIQASQYFFVGNVDDPDIRQALLWSLQHDPSVSNREAALQSLPVNAQTLDYILARIRDTKQKVRVQALQVLQKLPIEDWNAEEMAAVIETGYTDRCKSTKDATSKLVCLAWIKAVQYDPIQLLQKINVTLHEEACEKVIRILLDATDSTLSSLSAPEVRAFRDGIESASIEIKEATQELKVEYVFFSRVVCREASEDSSKTAAQKEAVIGSIVSDIPVLCEVIERHTLLLMQAINEDDSEAEDKLVCISLQLLQLASMADLEEGSRRHFSAVMKRMLNSILLPDDLVEGCVQALKSTCTRETEFMDTAADIVSELAKMLEEENAKAGLEVNHLLRILSILTIVLEHASPKMASNPIVVDFAKHIVPGVTHSDTLVREAAVSCFGKLGLLTNEETVLTEFKPLLLQMASKEEEKAEIRAQALLALSDWSILFADILKPCQLSNVSFAQIILDMMTRSGSSLSCIAAEVASKLLLSGKVCESQWLAHLIMIFFDGAENEEDEEMDAKEVGSPVRLQQLLCVFFPAYSIKSKQGREALLGSISPLLDLFRQQINRKKRLRGSKTWPIVKMIEYVCSTVDVGKNTVEKDREETKQEDIANGETVEESTTALLSSIQIAKFLAQHSHDLSITYLRALCKLLGGAELVLEKEETKHCAILMEAMEELGMAITDDACLRHLAKLNEVLSNVELNEYENEPIEDEDALAEALEKVEISNSTPVATDKENDLAQEIEPASMEKGRESTASSVASRRSLRSRSSN